MIPKTIVLSLTKKLQAKYLKWFERGIIWVPFQLVLSQQPRTKRAIKRKVHDSDSEPEIMQNKRRDYGTKKFLFWAVKSVFYTHLGSCYWPNGFSFQRKILLKPEETVRLFSSQVECITCVFLGISKSAIAANHMLECLKQKKNSKNLIISTLIRVAEITQKL